MSLSKNDSSSNKNENENENKVANKIQNTDDECFICKVQSHFTNDCVHFQKLSEESKNLIKEFMKQSHEEQCNDNDNNVVDMKQKEVDREKNKNSKKKKALDDASVSIINTSTNTVVDENANDEHEHSSKKLKMYHTKTDDERKNYDGIYIWGSTQNWSKSSKTKTDYEKIIELFTTGRLEINKWLYSREIASVLKNAGVDTRIFFHLMVDRVFKDIIILPLTTEEDELESITGLISKRSFDRTGSFIRYNVNMNMDKTNTNNNILNLKNVL